MSTFWNVWIIGITAITLVLVVWLLFSNRKTVVKGDLKEGEVPTTGHVYDGIEEYDNPLPGWWFKMFVGTVVFGLCYLILYPGMGSYAGALGWTQHGQWQEEMAEAEKKYGPVYAQFANMSAEELISNPEAMKMARRLFNNNCSTCHGADGGGGYGFPNLTDTDWLYGGAFENIKASITQGRQGAMPAWEQILGEEGIDQVAEYVFKISGRDHDQAKAAEGGKKFATMCASCHGVDGKGMQAVGAPNLTDGVWLYGGSPRLIRHTLRKGRNGKMPAHAEMLKAEKIHLLAGYVYQLSKNN